MPVWKLNDGIRLGKILKPNGYLGFVKVAFLISGLEDILFDNDFIFIEWIGKPVPYQIETILWDDDKTARIKFKDINDSDNAARLNGRPVILSEKTVPKDLMDSLEPSELIGFKVIDDQKRNLGVVTALDESGKQSILEVSSDEKEILIPFHEDLVTKIDFKKKTIHVDLPEGLLDLFE